MTFSNQHEPRLGKHPAAKADPGSVDMAHSGNWGALFVPAAQIMKATDAIFNLVPYQGGGPAMQA
ncbi:MAG: hypothetical protein AAGC55_33685, partial [Myxococcota bacterium]